MPAASSDTVRLMHENIADIRDFDSDEQGNPFYIMEYYCNNLGVMIGEHYRVEETSRILDPEKIFLYGSEILDGLGCLHHAGIVHRDIKPYNILITDQDTPKICDFGLSRVRGETFPSAHVLNVGSPYYAAPEQIADPESADQRADLYSVGVMLFRTDYCIAPLFDRRQKSLWTSDRRSRLAAWYVSVDLGFVAWQDITCFYHVRAVCSPMLRKKGGKTEAAGRRRENGREELVS